MFGGLFQSTGWPSVVAVVGNWFGKKKRGLIMGICNAHTSVGNITGSLVASALLQYGWGWSFVVPGLMIAFVGLMVFLLLPVSPQSIGADKDEDELQSPKKSGEGVTEPLLRSETEVKEKAVGFIEAWKIPGVAPFALCLFFSKLVAYTFLYWLPFYISHTVFLEGGYPLKFLIIDDGWQETVNEFQKEDSKKLDRELFMGWRGSYPEDPYLDVVYNASNNELVDAVRFRQWSFQHYGVDIGRKKKAAA
ncbi:hypothetical protein L1049_018230 [Liquidambar formosana]|uniref:Major facilitator superfamily (MFS) profile domain-containing protein n=1 Tax=Liquidambar formosana TaxID=63359 RepID=A0AAP0R9S2_LIQFO